MNNIETKKNVKPEVACPYFDKDKKTCNHPSCIRMAGFECRAFTKKAK